MAGNATGKLVSGLVAGAAIGATFALVLSSRASVALPSGTGLKRAASGPTPFEPANVLIGRARSFLMEVRAQVQQAVEEGKNTSARTRQELTARFEEAKRGEHEGK